MEYPAELDELFNPGRPHQPPKPMIWYEMYEGTPKLKPDLPATLIITGDTSQKLCLLQRISYANQRLYLGVGLSPFSADILMDYRKLNLWALYSSEPTEVVDHIIRDLILRLDKMMEPGMPCAPVECELERKVMSAILRGQRAMLYEKYGAYLQCLCTSKSTANSAVDKNEAAFLENWKESSDGKEFWDLLAEDAGLCNQGVPFKGTGMVGTFNQVARYTDLGVSTLHRKVKEYGWGTGACPKPKHLTTEGWNDWYLSSLRLDYCQMDRVLSSIIDEQPSQYYRAILQALVKTQRNIHVDSAAVEYSNFWEQVHVTARANNPKDHMYNEISRHIEYVADVAWRILNGEERKLEEETMTERYNFDFSFYRLTARTNGPAFPSHCKLGI